MSTFTDRFRGGFLGLGIGDALGAPYEMRYSFPLSEYTGIIYQPIKWKARYGPIQHSVIGQTSDDTQMFMGYFTK